RQYSVYPSQLVADTHGQRVEHRQRAIEIAATVAQTKAGRVEGVERHQHQLGHHVLARRRVGNAVTVGVQPHAGRPATERERRCTVRHHRERGETRGILREPARDELAHVGLGTKRPAESQPTRRETFEQIRKMHLEAPLERAARSDGERLACGQGSVSQRAPARYDVIVGLRFLHARSAVMHSSPGHGRGNMKHVLVGLMVVALAGAAFAQSGDKRILAARDALRSGDHATLERLAASADDHLLGHYVEYWRLLSHLDRRDTPPPTAALQAFVTLHSGSVPATRLAAHWLRRLAADEDWEGVLRVFPHTEPDVELRCLAWQARHRLGDAAVLDEVAASWRELL